MNSYQRLAAVKEKSRLLSSNPIAAGFWYILCPTIMTKGGKLKSTTVHFTDSDLHVIKGLQEKLGLGLIHVVRLAIRRLAEFENLHIHQGRKKAD